MTDHSNPARPEEDAEPAQPEEDVNPPAAEPEAAPAEEDAGSERPEEAAAEAKPVEAEPPAAEADPAAERDEFRDLLLRKQAEFDNYKKRVERDRARANRQAERTLIVALLPLLDDFERALGAAAEGSGGEAWRAGMELIHRELLEILRKRGVTPIDTAGARFDPNLHEAVAYQTCEGRGDGEVIDELRRGYRFGEELLRAAMVRVAKA